MAQHQGMAAYAFQHNGTMVHVTATDIGADECRANIERVTQPLGDPVLVELNQLLYAVEHDVLVRALSAVTASDSGSPRSWYHLQA